MGVTSDPDQDGPLGGEPDQDADDAGPLTADRASALIAKRIY